MARCKHGGCFAPKGLCGERLDNEYKQCPHWAMPDDVSGTAAEGPRGTGEALPWTGEAFEPKDISLISARSNPVIIGMVGTADAGKTSYLAMLFRLLFNGRHFEDWKFSGSYTLSAWETLAQYVVIRSDATVTFPPPTPSHGDYYSLYHLALRSADLFRDVLFADSSGEVFLRWAVDIDDPSADNARWIYRHSSAFVFFVDCQALAKRKGAALREIEQMAQQIGVSLAGRPVAVVWSKADKKADVRENIRAELRESLDHLLPGAVHLDVSNLSHSDEDPYCHKNNLAVVTKLLRALGQTQAEGGETELLLTGETFREDYFLPYRENYEIR